MLGKTVDPYIIETSSNWICFVLSVVNSVQCNSNCKVHTNLVRAQVDIVLGLPLKLSILFHIAKFCRGTQLILKPTQQLFFVLVAGPTTVTFGTNKASDVEYVSTRRIIGKVPTGVKGPTTVVVDNGGVSYTLKNAF